MMEREQYIVAIQRKLEGTLSDYRFNNFKKQIVAWKLSADFTRSYSEEYLWNRAIFLSTSACILILEDTNRRLAIQALKESAEIFESLSSIGENYDKDYCLILSSLCYDLSGYQANSYCLVKSLTSYRFISTDYKLDLSSDNYVLHHIRLILLKNISKAKSAISYQFQHDYGIQLVNKALLSWYESILSGQVNNFYEQIAVAYNYFIKSPNAPIAHLLFLLKTRLKTYIERSLWSNLEKYVEVRKNPIWMKYVKLLTNDIYDHSEIKEIDKRISKFEFWTSQLRALQKGLLESEGNFVVQMPTSAGKTFIAELAILNALVKHPNKKCIYIAPFRALTNEKERELADYLSKLGYSVSALSGSYEIDEFQDIVLEDTDVLIATPEKTDLLLRLNPGYFEKISLIVVDEGHIVGDITTRASLLESLIISLRIKVGSLRILFISAVMPPENADEYSIWLSGESDRVIRSLLHEDSLANEEWEPTRKLIGSFKWEGNNGRIDYINLETEDEETKVRKGAFVPSVIKAKQYFQKFPNKKSKPQTAATLALELSKDGRTLIFCGKPKDTMSIGNALLEILTNSKFDDDILSQMYFENTDTASYYYASKWYSPDHYILKCLSYGIGVHFGDLPESVRTAIEADYRNGSLQLLIATNTISQGINFPIKNIVVYSTIYGFDTTSNHANTISVRDFWNLVGRAGRAGKETEGRVIFVINSDKDQSSFNEYSNKSNIENAYSIFLNVLIALIERRITSSIFESNMRILSESYLLSLLTEEIVETDTQELIEKLINNSLFKSQADANKIDVQPIRGSLLTIAGNIREQVPDGMRKVFGETGFMLEGNLAISNFIDENKELLGQAIENDDYLLLLRLILTVFEEGQIEDVQSEKLDKINQPPSTFFTISRMWMQGVEIFDLQTEWRNISSAPSHLNILIAEGFYYRYTWGVTSFITILIAKLGLDRSALPENVKNLSTYLKYGLNNPTACLARSLGIKSRDTSLLLAEKANGVTGRAFIKWMANLTVDEINSYNINAYDRDNIINTAIKLTPNRNADVPTSFEFYIRGTPFEIERRESSLEVRLEDTLNYKRDSINEFDPFAIKIFIRERELGFVPREYSKLISVEIDVNGVEYQIIVTATEAQQNYIRIFVRMSKKEVEV